MQELLLNGFALGLEILLPDRLLDILRSHPVRLARLPSRQLPVQLGLQNSQQLSQLSASAHDT